MSIFLRILFFFVLFTHTTFSQSSIISDKQKEITEKTVALFQQGKIDEAISITKEFINSLKQSNNEKSDEMIGALTNLAFLRRQKIQREEKDLFARQIPFAQNPTYFNSVKNEATEAEYNLREALEICKNLGKSDSISASVAMRELALILQKNYAPQTVDISRKRIDEAETLFSQALAIQEKIVGETDKTTLQTLQDFIKLYDKFGNYEKIVLLSPKYIANAEKTYGQNDKNLLAVLEIYATTLYTICRDDELNLIVDKLKLISGQAKDKPFPIKNLSSRKSSSQLPSLSAEGKKFIPSGATIRVLVRIEVDEKGNVVRAQAEGNAHYFLNQSAEETAKKTTFRILMIGGKPSNYRGTITYTFSKTITAI